MKKPKGLPEWFDIENYDEVKALTPLEWYENLHKRRMFFVWYSLSQSDRLDLSAWRKQDAKERCEKFVNLIAKDPILKVSDDKEIYHSKMTVDTLRNGDLVHNYHHLADKAPPIFFEYLEGSLEILAKLPKKGDSSSMAPQKSDLGSHACPAIGCFLS